MQIPGAGALVTGGASGLGEAVVRMLHGEGAHVTIVDLNAEKGEALAAELGDGVSFVTTDVADADAVEAVVGEAARVEGGLRISVSCAGIGWAERTVSRKGPHGIDPFEAVVRVNLIGTFNVLRLAAGSMVGNDPNEEGERGVVINTASVAAFEGQIGQVAYSASKGGIVGMTVPAARDLARHGVRVVTIAPGLFDTPLLALLPEEARKALGDSIPFPSRLGQPGEYASLAAEIVRNPMLNGETIRLDGALRMPPR